jgi:leucyl-tRNA synthetase
VTTSKVYTTRVDTIYGATFLVLAPEHELVDFMTTRPARRCGRSARHQARRSERDRMSMHQNRVGAVRSARYALNPVNQRCHQTTVLTGYNSTP